MDEKQLVSQALSAAIDGVLGVEQIAAIIEKPKSSDLGDLAFPAFQLAKTLRKSPQIIAGEIAEKIDTKGFFNWAFTFNCYRGFNRQNL